MKNFYFGLATTVLALASLPAQSATTVNFLCEDFDQIEVRDGGAQGALIPVADSSQEITFDSDALYIAVRNDDKVIKDLYYTDNEGYSEYVSVGMGSYTLSADQLYTEGTPKVEVKLADAKKVYVNVPDPELIIIKPNEYGDLRFPLTEGLNTLALEPYGGLYFEVANPDDYKLTKVWNDGTEEEYSITNYTSCSIFSYDVKEDNMFSYTITPISEFTAPSFTLLVDDAEAVDVVIDYSAVKGLKSGVPNTIYMSEETEGISVRPANYDQSIYSVALNGVYQSISYDSYNFDVKEGDEVVVTVNAPDIKFDLEVISVPEENAPFITVSIDNEKLEDWSGVVKVQAGSEVKLSFDTDSYRLDGMTLNGETPSGYITYDYKFKMVENSVVEVKSTKYEPIKAIIDVAMPEAVSVYLGYTSSTPFELVSGENEIEFTENNNQLRIKRNDGYSINEIVSYINGEFNEEYKMSYGAASVRLEEGMRVVIDAGLWTDDTKAVVYSNINSNAPGFYQLALTANDPKKTFPFFEGYNTIEYNHEQAAMSFSAIDEEWDLVPCWVYVNGVQQQSRGWSGYSFTLLNNDVLKIFVNEEPAYYTAMFDIADDCEVKVMQDLVTELEEGDEIDGLQGTLFQISSLGEEKILDVYVAEGATTLADEGLLGTQVKPDEEGVYNVVLNADKRVTVRKAGVISGIVSVRDAATGLDIFTSTGVRVATGATPEALRSLPAGIYIVAGKKVVVK